MQLFAPRYSGNSRRCCCYIFFSLFGRWIQKLNGRQTTETENYNAANERMKQLNEAKITTHYLNWVGCSNPNAIVCPFEVTPNDKTHAHVFYSSLAKNGNYTITGVHKNQSRRRTKENQEFSAHFIVCIIFLLRVS